jgi:membrane protein DedA with SNARE-associated domain
MVFNPSILYQRYRSHMGLEELATQWVTSYGYVGVFALMMFGIVGIPVPDETLLTLAGFLVSRGRLSAIPTVATATLGSICGISCSYVIGRSLGTRFIVRYGRFLRVSGDDLDKVERWFERWGKWALPVGYFVPGVRHVIAILAGSSHLRPTTFAAFAYSGAFVWSTTFIGLGYFVGQDWRIVLAGLHRYVVLIATVVLLVVVLLLGVRRMRSRGTRTRS